MKRLVISSLVLVSLGACAGPRFASRPADSPTARARAAELYAVLEAQQGEVQSIQAEAELKLSRGIFSRAVDQVILVQRPESFRIDSYDRLGNLILQLIHHDGRLVIREGEHGMILRDDVDEYLAGEWGLPLSLPELMLFMFGRVPLESEENYLAVEQGDGWLLRGAESQVILAGDNCQITQYTGRTEDGVLYQVEYADYREVDGVLLPHHLHIEVSDPNFSMTLKYIDPNLNQLVPDAKFNAF